MKFWFCSLCTLLCFPALIRAQICPVNINFSLQSLTHWYAYTGNNQRGNGPSAIKQRYDSTVAAPQGTIGAKIIYEYNLEPPVPGIQVISSTGADYFGGFSTIPTINGYSYNYAVVLGSTQVNYGGVFGGSPGGYIRGISYLIDVPATPVGQPYTMTYAYAMVLENGTHNSDQQPKFSATLTTSDSVIRCASPSYYLPTLNNTIEGETGATLDSAAAIANGFSVSPMPSPNLAPSATSPSGVHLQDVWTKGWREVTFDLSPYRGQMVSLNFEADNCIPGGHFAYAYIALRNTCAGLQISGDSLVCLNSNVLYSVPALANGQYVWSWPSTWTNTLDSANFLRLTAGNQGGVITVREQNSCADLKDTILVNPSFPAIGGSLSGDTSVCSGLNNSFLSLSGNLGRVVGWLSSTSGSNWMPVNDTTANLAPQDLTATTVYRALVVNGIACGPDTSSAAIVTVDPKSVGGSIYPDSTAVCAGQNVADMLKLQGNTGSVQDWQFSPDNVNWTNINPVVTDSVYGVVGLTASAQYRAIVKSGVCPTDTSAEATIGFYNTPFPQGTIDPSNQSICNGGTATLSADITIGTSYTWSSPYAISTSTNGTVNSLPYSITTRTTPAESADYVLSIQNQGCPNPLVDTFKVAVQPPITVTAGDDTAVVVNQPLQLNASATDSKGDSFTYAWTPPTNLSNPNIANPVAEFNASEDTIRYTVTATSPIGCTAENSVLVRIFKTPPDIFVPNAFTPGSNINRLFRPICVGIVSLSYFRVFNRWGQLVFATSQIGQGWDGSIGGRPQESDTYVWMAQGTDFTGKIISKKGTVVLIR